MPHILLISFIEATKSTKKSSSSSSISFVVIIVLFAAAYFFFIRPRSKRARQAQTTVSNLSVGDEVISAGGILGTITAIAGDEISVEVSPGYTLTFWRRAINLRTAVKGAPQSTASPVDEEEPTYDDETSYDDEAGYENETAYGDEAGDEHNAAEDATADSTEADDQVVDGDSEVDEQATEGHDGEYGGSTGSGSSGDR